MIFFKNIVVTYAFTMFKGGKKILPVFLKSHVQHSSFLTRTNGIDY